MPKPNKNFVLTFMDENKRPKIEFCGEHPKYAWVQIQYEGKSFQSKIPKSLARKLREMAPKSS